MAVFARNVMLPSMHSMTKRYWLDHAGLKKPRTLREQGESDSGHQQGRRASYQKNCSHRLHRANVVALIYQSTCVGYRDLKIRESAVEAGQVLRPVKPLLLAANFIPELWRRTEDL
jgi:hypothetical protein